MTAHETTGFHQRYANVNSSSNTKLASAPAPSASPQATIAINWPKLGAAMFSTLASIATINIPVRTTSDSERVAQINVVDRVTTTLTKTGM